MKPFVAMPMECATRRSGGISVDDCAKTEILVCAFGADSESGARRAVLWTHELPGRGAAVAPRVWMVNTIMCVGPVLIGTMVDACVPRNCASAR